MDDNQLLNQEDLYDEELKALRQEMKVTADLEEEREEELKEEWEEVKKIE